MEKMTFIQLREGILAVAEYDKSVIWAKFYHVDNEENIGTQVIEGNIPGAYLWLTIKSNITWMDEEWFSDADTIIELITKIKGEKNVKNR